MILNHLLINSLLSGLQRSFKEDTETSLAAGQYKTVLNIASTEAI